MPRRLPSFLIVGAMKAGTTTLYHDLRRNPAIFLPEDKEPEVLITPDYDPHVAVSVYAEMNRRAGIGQICGEASTAYTKAPDHLGIAHRARNLLESDAKIIYVVRDPVDRIASHHRHEVLQGNEKDPIEVAVERDHRYVQYSRYAYQIEPWVDEFGMQNVFLVHFEHYVLNRAATLERLSSFLGAPFAGVGLDLTAVFNASENKPLVTDRWERIRNSLAYRRLVRPLTTSEIRARLRETFLPKADQMPAPPSSQLRCHLWKELRPEVARLSVLFDVDAMDWWTAQ